MEITNNIEFRKVQSIAKRHCVGITLPSKYVQSLGIRKGDFVKIHIELDKIVIELAR